MARKKRQIDGDGSPAAILENLAKSAVVHAKKAGKNNKSLSGDNFYGNKLVELRADATNTFNKLVSGSPGDTTALAELIEVVFSANTLRKKRLAAYKELSFSLKTTWKKSNSSDQGTEPDLFPLSILAQANRGYLVSIGRQMNGGFKQEWYDSCAVMMRRLVEIGIIEAFENKGIADKIKDAHGNYFQLSDLVTHALAETHFSLSRNTKKMLPQLRDIGHMSAHGRYFNAKKEDIERIQPACRIVIEEFLHHAGLL